ncbi:sugar phosphate isomerase/epimerase family protein [Martelella soudanensis]|uniref:sugar phosphate isomerase/epimerase family protein n=1 Tax=unclassified Martelella TaxID=2629616 RepID=UPI0015DE93DC|nr:MULTISPECIES: sugar phosphate isomerase/epimerase [unclassified Martelella]
MNKLGLHANVWVAGWSENEAAMAIEKTAATGFDLIEIPALEPSSLRPDETRRRLDAAGIGCTLSLGLDDRSDISSGDPQMMKAGEEKLRTALSVGRDLGATHVCGILYSAFQKYFEPPTRRGIEASAEVMRRVADYAVENDITLGMEVVNRYESNVLNTAAQAVAYCKMVDAPNVKVHLDAYHMHIEEQSPPDAIMATGKQLGYFHTGESHRGYIGSGSIDHPSLFRALVASGYDGPITYESFSSEVVGQPLTGILGIWRNTWTDGEDLARHAYTFTHAQLKAARETVLRASGFTEMEA